MRGKVGKGEWIQMSHLPLQLPHSASVLRYRDIMHTQSGQLQTHIIRLKPHKPVFVRHIEAAKQALISKNHSNVISPVSGGPI